MKYCTAMEISARWGISVRRVQELCKNGRINGAVRHGREWLVPENSLRPADGRSVKSVPDNGERDDYRTYYSLILYYDQPGCVSRLTQSFEDDKTKTDMFQMQLSIYRCEFEKARAIIDKYFDSDAGINQRALIGVHAGMCAAHTGDIALWKKSEAFLSGRRFTDNTLSEYMEFIIGAHASLVYDTALFPGWLRRGDLTPIPSRAYPIAQLYYARCLYITAHEMSMYGGVHSQALSLMENMPNVLELLISQAYNEKTVISEIYLRLMCAIAYSLSGKEQLAVSHVRRAVELARPDGLILPLAEARYRIPDMLDQELEKQDEDMYLKVKKFSKSYDKNWAKLRNGVRFTSLSTTLTAREKQIALFATYGLSNKEISQRLNISVNGVKQSLRNAMDKTGAQSRKDLHLYI